MTSAVPLDAPSSHAGVAFAAPLVRGRLIRRYKRFLADIRLDTGELVVAHCPNPGSMLSVDPTGGEVWLSPAGGSGRKLAYTWELVRIAGTLVGINTGRPNAIAADAIQAGAIRELAGYSSLRREVRYGAGCRIDLLLQAPGRPPCYVEVKSVTMRRGSGPGDPVEFPDAVTVRGLKHLGALAAAAAEGARAVMLFLAQRDDGRQLSIARDIDPGYAGGLRSAMAAGVEVLAYGCRVSTAGIRVAAPLPLLLDRAAAVDLLQSGSDISRGPQHASECPAD
jgi:sugar fermentation stimulation protein A